ncbi:MAG: hypothetical protein Q7Q71_00435 [Verrucomicrobiota bacterium JB023]|nr:hypothetical protein [Verrucomicrobiota bacterium JB023]
MDFQIATLCDYAADHQGKMTVVAPFDALATREFPVRHPQCCLALRVCMTPEDNGDHTMNISLIDEDGQAVNPQMPIKADMPVKIPDEVSFVTRNMIVNFQGLEFKKAGVYSLDINLDGELMVRLPLRVVKVDPKQQQQQPA